MSHGTESPLARGLCAASAAIIQLAVAVSTVSAQGTGQTPSAAVSAPRISLSLAMRRATPSVRWNSTGLLIYETSARDSTSRVALDPRTGVATPYLPQSTASFDQPRIVGAALFSYQAPLRELPSPDGGWFAAVRAGDVWIRKASSSDSVRLSSDGRADDGFVHEGARWSPTGTHIAVKWLDGDSVPTTPLVRWQSPGAPVVRHPYSRAGETIPRARLFIFDRQSGRRVEVRTGDSDAPYLNVVGWASNGEEMFFTRVSRVMDRLELLAADPTTGATRLVLTETSETYIEGLPYLHGNSDGLDSLRRFAMLPDGRRFIWTSERDGWRRLYLHSLDGRLIRPLTPPLSEVRRVEAIDGRRGLVYYIAAADSMRPYDHTLYRVPVDGGVGERVLAGPDFSTIEFSPSRQHFWTRRSAPDRPSIVEVRRADGTLVRQLWSGEAVANEWGWTPPEQVVATAADGVTKLHGLLFRPRDFDASRKYPVVDFLYGGPNSQWVPRSPHNYVYGASQELADLGFIVLLVDARGTPGRGRAFRTAFFGKMGQHEIADHAAVLRRAAADRPWMDLTRVGAIGGSWGGYWTIRAMLLEPDLYRVGVAFAPAVTLEHFRVSVEPFMGCVPARCPDAYASGSNLRLADRLQGKLLLIHGALDDDVPIEETVRFIAALQRAGKPYDLVVLPDADHNLLPHPYAWQRMKEYFVKHLGQRPISP